jgi:hypothetical protein
MLRTMTTPGQHTTLLRAVLVAIFAVGCASAPRVRTEANAPVRVKDSAAEKLAAHRAASGNLRLEHEEERWGFEAARERRRERGSGAKAYSRDPETVPAPATGSTERVHLTVPR